MGYECQNFKNGQVLNAECLNRMEQGIKDACDAAPPECSAKDCSRILSHGENGCEWIPIPIEKTNPTIGDNAWSSKILVDKLCPVINKRGTLVQCEPRAGSSILVDVDFVEGVSEITVCGKNLYDAAKYPLSINGYPYSGTDSQGIFSSSENYRRTDFIPVSHLVGCTIVTSHPTNAKNPGISFYKRIPDVKNNTDCKDAWCGGTTGAIIKVPDDAEYMVFCVPVEKKDDDVQIELGSVATSYEPYTGYTIVEPELPVEIAAAKGINTVFAVDYFGNEEIKLRSVTVTGIADPIAIVKSLTSRVEALEAAAVSNA